MFSVCHSNRVKGIGLSDGRTLTITDFVGIRAPLFGVISAWLIESIVTSLITLVTKSHDPVNTDYVEDPGT